MEFLRIAKHATSHQGEGSLHLRVASSNFNSSKSTHLSQWCNCTSFGIQYAVCRLFLTHPNRLRLSQVMVRLFPFLLSGACSSDSRASCGSSMVRLHPFFLSTVRRHLSSFRNRWVYALWMDWPWVQSVEVTWLQVATWNWCWKCGQKSGISGLMMINTTLLVFSYYGDRWMIKPSQPLSSEVGPPFLSPWWCGSLMQ